MSDNDNDLRLIFIVEERKTFTTLINIMVMAESAERQGGTPHPPGGLKFSYLSIMKDVNEA